MEILRTVSQKVFANLVLFGFSLVVNPCCREGHSFIGRTGIAQISSKAFMLTRWLVSRRSTDPGSVLLEMCWKTRCVNGDFSVIFAFKLNDFGDREHSGFQETVKSNTSENVHMISEQQCVISILEAFLITSTLPSSFMPHIENAPGKHTPLVSAKYSFRNHFSFKQIVEETRHLVFARSIQLFQADAVNNGGWCLLYNSNNQGLSFNR